jgi:hypothetical protein
MLGHTAQTYERAKRVTDEHIYTFYVRTQGSYGFDKVSRRRTQRPVTRRRIHLALAMPAQIDRDRVPAVIGEPGPHLFPSGGGVTPAMDKQS